MKGYTYIRKDGQIVDAPPCRACKYYKKMTVEAPCYGCIDPCDLALHKPNRETEFACFEPADCQE